MPRLAIHEPWTFGQIARLRDVRIENGFIYGQKPDPADLQAYWDPLREYFRAEKPPYMAFIKSMDFTKSVADEESIIDFVEQYGIPLSHSHRSSRDTIVWSVADFDLHQSLFWFILTMSSRLRLYPHQENDIRSAWQAWLSDAARKCKIGSMIPWRTTLNDIHTIMRLPPVTNETMMPGYLAQSQALENYFKRADAASLVRDTSGFMSRCINTRISNLTPWFVYDVATRGARLYAQSDALLDQFYWMLANDLQGQRAPVVCGTCQRIFFTSKDGVRYCPDRSECRERGRRRLDWARNRDKYNRNRRVKRRSQRSGRSN